MIDVTNDGWYEAMNAILFVLVTITAWAQDDVGGSHPMESWPFFLVCLVVTPRLVCGAETLCAKVIGGSSCQCQTPRGLSPLSNAVGARYDRV